MTRQNETANQSGTSVSALCKHCGGPIKVRNQTGTCDHLYWPENLTDEAKRANGFRLVTKQVWEDGVEITGHND